MLDGHDLGALSDAEQTRLRLATLGFVFQRFHLLDDLTALENVALPMEAAGCLPTSDASGRRAARAVGLGERLEFRPAHLSGGQRQRVAIARALANDPRIILADEPTGELHSEDKAHVIELFRRFHAEGRAIVMVTHDPDVAAVAERQIEIRDGHVSEMTQPAAIEGTETASRSLALLPPDAVPCPITVVGVDPYGDEAGHHAWIDSEALAPSTDLRVRGRSRRLPLVPALRYDAPA